jgi:hypothetical protein
MWPTQLAFLNFILRRIYSIPWLHNVTLPQFLHGQTWHWTLVSAVKVRPIAARNSVKTKINDRSTFCCNFLTDIRRVSILDVSLLLCVFTPISLLQLHKILFKLVRGTILLLVLENAAHTFFVTNLSRKFDGVDVFYCRVYKLLISQLSPNVPHNLRSENSKLFPEETLAYLRALSTDKRHFKTLTRKTVLSFLTQTSPVILLLSMVGNSKSQQWSSFKVSLETSSHVTTAWRPQRSARFLY